MEVKQEPKVTQSESDSVIGQTPQIQVQKPNHQFILIRHPITANDPTIQKQKSKSKLPHNIDPHLSRPQGKQDAQKTASFVRQILSENHGLTSETMIFCSPYLAAIEQAACLLSQLRLSKNVIFVTDYLSELQMASWIEQNQAFDDPFLTLSTKLTVKLESLISYLEGEYKLKNLTIIYNRSPEISYPDTLEVSISFFFCS